jgi:hypothetical protein
MHPTRKTLWVFAFLLAILTACLGFRFHAAAWAMYIEMPGIMVGLICGWIYDRATHGDSPFNPAILVVGLTILLNASVYYLIFTGFFSSARSIGNNPNHYE